MTERNVESTNLAAVAVRWWYVLLVAALLGAVTGGWAAQFGDPTYRSTARVLVGPYNAQLDTVRASGLLVQTYADALRTDAALRRAADEAGVTAALRSIRESVNVTANDTTRVLTISVDRGRAEEATAIATELVAIVSEFPALTERQLVTEVPAEPPAEQPPLFIRPEGEVTVIDPPVEPERPLAEPVALVAMVAGSAAALIAFGVVAVAEGRSGRTFRGGVELGPLVQRRLLGACDLHPSRPFRTDRLVVDARPHSSAADDYRLVATKLELLAGDDPLRSVAVCGAREPAGSAEVAANLALTFARRGRDVVLADLTADPTIAKQLQVALRERRVARASGTVVELAILPAGLGYVHVMIGHDVAPVSGGAGGDADLVEALSEMGDLVVLHAPPALIEPAIAITARKIDSVAIVAPDDREATEVVTDALDAMERLGIRLVGAVVTTGSRRRSRDISPLHEGDGTKVREPRGGPPERDARQRSGGPPERDARQRSGGPPARVPRQRSGGR